MATKPTTKPGYTDVTLSVLLALAAFIEKEDDPHLLQLVENNRTVVVKNLTKHFSNAAGQQIKAVDGLSFKMYEIWPMSFPKWHLFSFSIFIDFLKISSISSGGGAVTR